MIKGIIQGHVLDVLRTLPNDHVQMVCSSPPYWGLRSYKTEPQVWGGDKDCPHKWQDGIKSGISGGLTSKMQQRKEEPNFQIVSNSCYAFCHTCGAWRGELGLEPDPSLYVQHLVEVFREVKRVLRPDGTLFLNLGDSYISARGRYSSVQQTISGKCRGEPINGNRPDQRGHPYLKDKDLCGIPWMVAFALQADGWWLRSDCIWNKPNPMPESVTDRPTRSHEYIFMLTKNARYFYDANAVRERADYFEHHNRYHTKGTGRIEHNKNAGNLAGDNAGLRGLMNESNGTRNLRSVWTFSTQPLKMLHFSSFPEELVKRCILAGSSHKACEICGAAWVRVVEIKQHKISNSPITGIGDAKRNPDERTDLPQQRTRKEVNTLGFRPSCGCQQNGSSRCLVLDPFGGSGTVGKVATELGRDYILIELKPEYVKMARKRVRTTAGLGI